MEQYPNPHNIFESDLDYVTKTQGWTAILNPYWQRIVLRQERKVRMEERNIKEGKTSNVQYELGKLDGMKEVINSVESIKKGIRLRSQKIPSLVGEKE